MALRHLPHGPTSDTRGFENAAVVSDYFDTGRDALELIPHEVDGTVIPQRVTDGYINATALCQATCKQFNDYCRLKSTQAFLEEFSAETGIPDSGMVAISKGGNIKDQGTWIHLDVAVTSSVRIATVASIRRIGWVFMMMMVFGETGGGSSACGMAWFAF